MNKNASDILWITVMESSFHRQEFQIFCCPKSRTEEHEIRSSQLLPPLGGIILVSFFSYLKRGDNKGLLKMN